MSLASKNQYTFLILFDSTDEDARQAFQLNNGKIKEIQIKLLLSSRTEMQKVIEAARTTQTPFMQNIPHVSTPAVGSQTSLISQSSTPEIKRDDKDKDPKARDDSKTRRDRARRRTRSRSRSRDRKDRSRDRRDRRRRDRSRSRDRRDRRRDRRGRSRSRDRTRSRDRDTRRSRDDKRDNKPDIKNNEDNIIEIKDDPKPHPWENKPILPGDNNMKPQAPLLGNYPGNASSLEEARRSLGLLASLQNNIVPPMNDMNNGFQRNDMNNPMGARDNWQRKGRFHDRNQMSNDNMAPGMANQFAGNMPPRPIMMNPNMNMGNPGMELRPNMFQGGMRMPIPQDNNGFNANRPFLSRPGTMFPEQQQFRQQDRNQQYNVNNDDQFRNDPRSQFKGCCVQLRPYFGGYGEVRKFFGGLFINNTGLKFVSDNTGKKTGIVYVRFVRPEGKDEALNRSGMLLRGIPVEVAHLDDDEFERYGDGQLINEDCQDLRKDLEAMNSPRLQRFTCVVVDDLPEFAKEHDILKLFSDYTILSVHMIVNKQYRQLAYVQFSKEEEAKNAIADKTTHVISGKPVTVRPIADEVFAEVLRQHTNGDPIIDDNISPIPQEHSDNFQPNAQNHMMTDVVLLSGMPLKTSERDVKDFFSDIGLVPVGVHMLLGKFGPTGECYCVFSNPDEASGALDKNAMPLGTGTVRVELFPRREMERNLGLPSSAAPMNQQQGPGPRFQGRFGPRGPNMMGPSPRGPPNMIRRRPQGPGMRYEGPVDQMGPPGCVVTMENVPFKAGVNEILEFFESFDISNHNVFRRFNDNGAPTGDARVTFNSPAEAHRAVEECNKMKIRDRTVYLRVL